MTVRIFLKNSYEPLNNNINIFSFEVANSGKLSEHDILILINVYASEQELREEWEQKIYAFTVIVQIIDYHGSRKVTTSIQYIAVASKCTVD